MVVLGLSGVEDFIFGAWKSEFRDSQHLDFRSCLYYRWPNREWKDIPVKQSGYYKYKWVWLLGSKKQIIECENLIGFKLKEVDTWPVKGALASSSFKFQRRKDFFVRIKEKETLWGWCFRLSVLCAGKTLYPRDLFYFLFFIFYIL